MARAIDADIFIRDLTAMKKMYDAIELDGMIKALKEAPTIDSVKHGKWLDNGERDMCGAIKPFSISCSVCGSSQGTTWMKHCPNCGADMRGE